MLQAIKYGVIGVEQLCKDLREWDTCYVSGRLQKPVLHLKEDAEVLCANEQNLKSALTTSLLLLPSSFSVQVGLQALLFKTCHCSGQAAAVSYQ